MPWTSNFLRHQPANIIVAGAQAFAVGCTVYKLATVAYRLYASHSSHDAASTSISIPESSNGHLSTRDPKDGSPTMPGSGETPGTNLTERDTKPTQLYPGMSAARVEPSSPAARNHHTSGGQIEAAWDEEPAQRGSDGQQADDLSEETESQEGVGTDEDTETESDSEADLLATFQPVIDAIDFEALTAAALEIRRTQMASLEPSYLTQLETVEAFSCEINLPPLFGSYNIVYTILFSDGVKWVARIPGKALMFEDLDVQAMNSDYQTLRYIRQNTSLPVPDVIHWETTSDRIGAPYALMSFIVGTQICERWFDKSWITEQKRLKILDSIASHLSKLHRLRFAEIGALQFCEGKPRPEMIGSVWLASQGDTAWGKSHLSGPYDSLKSYLVADWDKLNDCAMRARCTMDILRLAVDSIPDFMTGQSQFPLALLDFNWQNIFIDDDANVVGFIDWDGVHARPSCLGFARYPSWITRDWDPAMYAWDPEDEDIEESSPADLSRYRQHYAKAFETFNLPSYDVRETRLSHIIEAIDIALRTRPCRGPIVRTLLNHAFHNKCPFALPDYADAFEEGKTGDMNKQIAAAFKRMWHAEWEHSEDVFSEDDSSTGTSDGSEDGEEDAHNQVKKTLTTR